MRRFRNGEDLRYLSLVDRKLRLHAVVLYCDHINGDGDGLFRLACEHDLAGVVAKRKSDPYLDATRSLMMLKSLNTDAFAPSIAVIGKDRMAPGEHLDVFNPFFQFDSNVPLSALRYSFCLLREVNEQERERNLHRFPEQN